MGLMKRMSQMNYGQFSKACKEGREKTGNRTECGWGKSGYCGGENNCRFWQGAISGIWSDKKEDDELTLFDLLDGE